MNFHEIIKHIISLGVNVRVFLIFRLRDFIIRVKTKSKEVTKLL